MDFGQPVPQYPWYLASAVPPYHPIEVYQRPMSMHRTFRIGSLVSLASLPVTLGAQQSAARHFREASEHRILAEFMELLAVPNVASDTSGIRRNAELITAMLEKRRLSPRLLRSRDKSAPPLIYGEWRVPTATRTIVFYAHYDGQPTDPAKWTGSAPWKPVLRSGPLDRGGRIIAVPAEGMRIDPEYRIYARSASDDKAGVMAFIAAIDALRAASIAPSVNVKLVFDGEEEAGSPHLDEIIRENAAILEADAWIICDGPVHQSGRKQVVYGVRGDMNADVTVYGANRPLHSGHYGNWAPNPAFLLTRLLASMKDESGRVLIRGWYDDVLPLGELEKKAIRDLPPFDDSLRTQLGFARPDGGGMSLAELINQPSLNINGIVSAEAGPAARNIIPATASATLDLRLVKAVDYRRQIQRLIDHIEAQGFTVLDRAPTADERLRYDRIAMVKQRGGGYNAERTPMDLPVSRSVLAAIESVFPRRTLAIPTLGGSLPLSVISEALHVPTITVPIVNYDNNQHAEDENLRIQNLWDGIEMMAALMTMK
jgi:acetylornithine deacetylase/succinyl-diaminopimelate desuccinylase-like protein